MLSVPQVHCCRVLTDVTPFNGLWPAKRERQKANVGGEIRLKRPPSFIFKATEHLRRGNGGDRAMGCSQIQSTAPLKESQTMDVGKGPSLPETLGNQSQSK